MVVWSRSKGAKAEPPTKTIYISNVEESSASGCVFVIDLTWKELENVPITGSKVVLSVRPPFNNCGRLSAVQLNQTQAFVPGESTLLIP